jgi:hydroxyacylglutathione hydrolase
LYRQEIQTIALKLPVGLGSVNCYLISTSGGRILVDTGGTGRRAELVKALVAAGCTPANFKLIVLTHGDFDHCGNAAYLRKKYGARIAMHPGDAGMAEFGDMFWNRKRVSRFLRIVAPLIFRLPKADRFRPDIRLEDGASLAEFGWDAQVLNLPGHSSGSIGLLTPDGDLFCGDLFVNSKKPVLNEIIDDPSAAKASVERLKAVGVKRVYPGHGGSFAWGEIIPR